MTALGTALLVLATSSYLLAVVAGVIAVRTGSTRASRWLWQYLFFGAAAVIASVLAMEWALLTHDFSVAYVVRNHQRATPVLYTIASLWGALEGSILLWALVVALGFAFVAVRFRRQRNDDLVLWTLIVGGGIALFFTGLMVAAANPFAATEGAIPADGLGMNPLLRNHILMVVHPPMLYLGYAGFSVPFAFAAAALITGRLGEGWLLVTRRATLVAWGFLTIGIVMGGWWSYEVLGWGGYWAWDPVENASLLPWLTGTAYLHSVVIQERRAMLRVWNLSLLLATYCLTILGTFLTRSGVVNSVHAFSESSIGPALLGFLAAISIGGIALIGARGERLRSPGQIESPVSREAAFLANNFVLAALAFVVLLGTVFPLFAEALNGEQLSVGEPYFDRLGMPLGLTILFLMAVTPLLPWRAGLTSTTRDRMLIPAWVGGGMMIVAVASGIRGLGPVLTLGLAAFALAGIASQFKQGWNGTRSRNRRAPGRVVALLRSHPRRYGGFVVHAGVVVVAVSIAGSQSFSRHIEAQLSKGEEVQISSSSPFADDYTVRFDGIRSDATAEKTISYATLSAWRDGESLGTFEPSIALFPLAQQAIGTPAVRTGLVEDLYLTVVRIPEGDGDVVTIGIGVNPMMLWLWLGAGLMMLGTAIALLPRTRAAAAGSASRAPTKGTLAGPEPMDVPLAEGNANPDRTILVGDQPAADPLVPPSSRPAPEAVPDRISVSSVAKAVTSAGDAHGPGAHQ